MGQTAALTQPLMKAIPVILCENGPMATPVLFEQALQTVVVWEPHDLLPALAALDAARASGHWIAGYVAYEAGYVLEPTLVHLMPPGREGPLLAFGVYASPKDADAVMAQARAEARDVVMGEPVPLITQASYDAAFAKVAAYIAAGDCYQINLTFPMQAQLTQGTALGLYGALRARQRVGHGMFCDLGQGPVVVSRSPELFFTVDGAGQISARPMKGTAPRDPDPARDAAVAAALQASQKDRAENLMIVDLLRNDISRLSEIGSVKVPELFKVEAFATVHQMSSRVIGQLIGKPGLGDLLTALFPCGSITGAPKIRAMQIIRQVEPHPRGAYCGAMGWMAPDGRASFNVAIRTLRLFEGGRVAMNVGGGVVHDSTAAGEWEEALWKARFAEGLARRA
jgi:para-aminobenzoate synthetase component I